jgi:hypothetical protein
MFVRALLHQPDAAVAALLALPRGRFAVKDALAARLLLDPDRSRCARASWRGHLE